MLSELLKSVIKGEDHKEYESLTKEIFDNRSIDNVELNKMKTKGWKSIAWDKLNVDEIGSLKNKKKAMKLLFDTLRQILEALTDGASSKEGYWQLLGMAIMLGDRGSWIPEKALGSAG